MNEGWTIYLERRIIAVVHGEAYRDFSSIIGWKALGKLFLYEQNSKLTIVHRGLGKVVWRRS